MSVDNLTIKNLVFEGGGVKGAVYGGCIAVLEEQKMYDQIEKVAGTSAGAITATLLACGAGSSGLLKSIRDTNFSQFIYDRGGLLADVFRVFRHYGIHSGNGFVKALKKNIATYGGNAELTFAQLEEKVKSNPKRFKHLTVVASNISTQLPQVFDAQNTPDVPIWKAVRASMSIPVLFEPFKIGNDYYVDGGLAWVYPIDIFDKRNENGEPIFNKETLGFYLESNEKLTKGKDFAPGREKIDSLKSAAEAMVLFAVESANLRTLHPKDKYRSVFVDTLGVKSTNFDISKEKIEELISSGRKATRLFLQTSVQLA